MHGTDLRRLPHQTDMANYGVFCLARMKFDYLTFGPTPFGPLKKNSTKKQTVMIFTLKNSQ